MIRNEEHEISESKNARVMTVNRDIGHDALLVSSERSDLELDRQPRCAAEEGVTMAQKLRGLLTGHYGFAKETL